MSAEDIQRNPEAAWDIIASYFDNDRLDHLQQLVRHQIESYNDFVQTQIRRTVEMFTPFTPLTLFHYSAALDNGVTYLYAFKTNFFPKELSLPHGCLN